MAVLAAELRNQPDLMAACGYKVLVVKDWGMLLHERHVQHQEGRHVQLSRICTWATWRSPVPTPGHGRQLAGSWYERPSVHACTSGNMTMLLAGFGLSPSLLTWQLARGVLPFRVGPTAW